MFFSFSFLLIFRDIVFLVLDRHILFNNGLSRGEAEAIAYILLLVRGILFHTSLYLAELLSPLQGLSTPTTQIPICLTPVSLLVLLVPDVVLEGACAFAIVADADNESRLSPITENKNTNMALLLPLFIGFFVVEMSVELDNTPTVAALLNVEILCCF
jgi:hypothetical protein